MRPASALLLASVLVPSLALAQGAAPRPAAPAKEAVPPAAAAPQIFPCRSADETCFLAVVAEGKLAVIYTNANNGQGIDAKTVELAGNDGVKMDIAKDNGRVVMVLGAYDPKTGIKGEVVETASPLVSLAIKAQLGGGEAAGPQRGAPARRR